METIWLIKLLLSHFLTDFFLQRKTWIQDRKQKKWGSGYLYLHTLITAVVAWLMIGWNYWVVALIILITHTLIDGWKSYMKDSAGYFLADQFLHITVILVCWWFTFYDISDIGLNWKDVKNDVPLWSTITAFIFLTWPCSYLIGHLTGHWRSKLANADALENAGKWIGIIERFIILVFLLRGQYDAIGLLIAAKGLIRFSDAERTEQKTEYLLIGTLISISLALVTGLIILQLIK